MKTTLVIPKATEKSYQLSLANNTYIFIVPLKANKNEIKKAVEEQFEVTVTNIKTLIQSGKAIRFSRGKNRYPGTTNRSDIKKAYVTLKEGDKLNIFDQVEEATSEDKKDKEAKYWLLSSTIQQLLVAVA